MSLAQAEQKYLTAQTKFQTELITEIERLATAVILTHPWAKSYCMAMGSASFGCEWVETDEYDPDDKWERKENLEPDELSSSNQFAAELFVLLDKWDETFKLTGYPMMIKFVKGHLTTLTDW